MFLCDLRTSSYVTVKLLHDGGASYDEVAINVIWYKQINLVVKSKILIEAKAWWWVWLYNSILTDTWFKD